MRGIPVKYNGVVVGWTDENSNEIKFEDNPEANKLKEELLKGESIGISSRSIGSINKDGKVSKKDTLSHDIIKTKES